MKTNATNTVVALIALIIAVFCTSTAARAQQAASGGASNTNSQLQARAGTGQKATATGAKRKIEIPKTEYRNIKDGPAPKPGPSSASKPNGMEEALRMEKAVKLTPYLSQEKYGKRLAREWKIESVVNGTPLSYISVISIEGKQVFVYYILPWFNQGMTQFGSIIFMWNDSGKPSGEEFAFDWIVAVDIQGRALGGVGPKSSKVCVLTLEPAFGGKIVGPQHEKYWQGVADDRVSKTILYFEGSQDSDSPKK